MENETNTNTNPQEEMKPFDPAIQFTSPPSLPQEPQNLQVQPEPPVQPEPLTPSERPTFNPASQPEINRQNVNQVDQAPVVPSIKYAGFWIRWIANFIDGIVVGIPLLIIFLPIGFILAASMGSDKAAGLPWPINLSIRLLEAIIGWTYYIFMTNRYQATLGKMVVGIKVVSDKAESLNLGQIILRETLGKFLSGITLGIGYIMAGFTKRKQALHDMIAKTTVIYKDPNKKMSGCVITAVILACMLPIIAIIGILASIVLVSLSSAKNKAADSSTRANLSSQMASAMIYYDEKKSYNGFLPDFITVKLQSCAGSPVTNISPDGKKVAIFAKSCVDSKKYFCNDATSDLSYIGKTVEVDEQYAADGKFACK